MREREVGSLAGDRHLVDEAGQLVADGSGGLREAAQRVDDLTGDGEGRGDREGDGGERATSGDDGGAQRGGRDLGGPRVGGLAQLALQGVEGHDLGVGGDAPVLGRDEVVELGLAGLDEGPVGVVGLRAVERGTERRDEDALAEVELADRGRGLLVDGVRDREETGQVEHVALARVGSREDRATERLLLAVVLDQVRQVALRGDDGREPSVVERVGDLSREVRGVLDDPRVVVDDRLHGDVPGVDAGAHTLEARDARADLGERLRDLRVERVEVDLVQAAVERRRRVVDAATGLLELGAHVERAVVARVREGGDALLLDSRRELAGLLQRGEQRDDRAARLHLAQRLERAEPGEHEEDEHRHGEGREDLPADAQPAKHGCLLRCAAVHHRTRCWMTARDQVVICRRDTIGADEPWH